MVTRGHYIGEIIDSLSDISSKVDFRCSVKMYDLNLVLEDFFKRILNIMFDYNLVNANQIVPNCPGIDLIEDTKKIAIQVTSINTLQKVNNTLNKLTPCVNIDVA